ncbi:MAG: D-inositol 3-phosphate glycosyltransferase [Chlamydiae bacterium]|nr:D-inositol 3-phosphate glycosyltransferase [Chlamydiota bacterium]
MIKIAFLKSRITHRGGLEKYTLKLAQAFKQAGCEVTLLTTEKMSVSGVEVVSLAKSSKFSLYHLFHFDRRCKQWLKDHPQDIIFGMERNSFQTHYRAGSGCHAVYLKRRALTDSWIKRMTFRLNPLHLELLHLEKKAFQNPGLKILFTNSKMVKQEILNTYHLPEEKIEVVYNGVEWKAWESSFEASFKKPRKKTFEFLFVGNGYRRKGLAFLLEGLARLSTQDFHLSVIGKEKNAAHFQQLAQKLGLEKKVTFRGPRSAIRPFYQAADVLVIPSIYDPFANVTVEALAMGLFVVSSRYNGGQEILTEKSGTIIEQLNDPHSVAAALSKALHHKKEYAHAKKIRDSIQQLDFSHQLDKIVQKTIASI